MNPRKLIAAFGLILTVAFVLVAAAHGIAAAATVFVLGSMLLIPQVGVPGALCVTTNTTGSLAASGILYDALGVIIKRLPFLSMLARDVAPAMAQKGMPFNVAQILKNFNPTHTVSDRGTTGTYAKQAGVDFSGDQNFTMDQWPYVTLQLTATEVNQMVDTYTNADARAVAIRKLLLGGMNKLATRIVNDFLAVITKANFANYYVSAASSLTYATLGAAVDVLLTNDGYEEKPTGILSIAAYREFANTLIPVPNFSGVDELVRENAITEAVTGCSSVSRYNVTMPVAAARGFLIHPAGMVYANRIPLEESLPNDPVFMEIVTDPETGFSILYREAKDPMTGEVARTITTMYGFAKGLSNHAVRITATDSNT